MYCARCSLHFSGPKGDGRCPYCGHPAEPTGDAVSVAVETRGHDPAALSHDPARAAPPAVDPDRTHTEAGPPGPWVPGAVIAGKYEVVARLGSGGFGSVYKVRHVHRKKYYALKTPHAEFSRDDVFRRRFEREIEAMERFVHPDAVMIRDSGITEEGLPYYTMDFIEGESLKAVLRREVRLPVPRAVLVIVRVLRVLEVAHAHGIIHRDIKPDNILLTTVNGRDAVKVLDFGVAKLLDLVGESNSITRGDRVGTPRYMSPEQITGEAIDPRSDLFSLGIVFYEAVTGQHPFARGRDPIRVTAAILNREAEPPRDLVPEIPRTLSDRILAMIEKRVRRRPASASLLLEEIEGLYSSTELPRSSTELPWGEAWSAGAPAARVEIHPAARRAPARTLVLREATSAGERRCFLLFDERVSMGRSNDATRGVMNQLILRCLPCRSRELDPENWQKNLTISHAVGTLRPDGSALVLDPAPGARHAIGIGGVKSLRTARIPADRFHLSIGDRALELDGHRFAAGDAERRLDLGFLAEGRPAGAMAGALTGYSNPACRIDCVRLLRASNWPLHEYYIVYRVLPLGATPSAPLRLRQEGPDGMAAAVIHEGGEAFLLARGPGVRVVDAPAGSADATRVEAELRPGMIFPLLPGQEILLGENRFRVEAAAESDFKTT